MTGTPGSDTVYDEIGVTTLVNATGSITTMGGSLLPPEVRREMDRAAEAFVRMDELMEWAGERIAAATGAEAGLVTSGAAGGIVLAGAACLTGRDRDRMDRLPETAGADEFVVQRLHRISHARGLRTAGGRLREVGDESGTDPGQIAVAIDDSTAALFHVVRNPQPTVPLEDATAVAHEHGVPVIVDAAAELPPPGNLQRFLEAGADLVVFSGGKNLRGPNDAGLLCGRGDLVAAARMQAFPNDGIGRPMKVSKEQIVGQVTALQRWVDRDHDAKRAEWAAMAKRVCEALEDLPGVAADVACPTGGPRPLGIPRARIAVEESTVGHDAAGVRDRLREGEPPVAVASAAPAGVLWVNPEHLREDEAELVAGRLRAVLAG